MATVVAFNTIIYIGLTLSKLIPMPRQFHPDRVRHLLRRLGFDPDKDATMDDIPRPEAPETDDPYENIRREIARRDIPQAFGLVGGSSSYTEDGFRVRASGGVLTRDDAVSTAAHATEAISCAWTCAASRAA